MSFGTSASLSDADGCGGVGKGGGEAQAAATAAATTAAAGSTALADVPGSMVLQVCMRRGKKAAALALIR